MCQKWVCVRLPGCTEYLGLPRLPNWIVRSDMADLHNLVVSFTASHGLSDEWHPQKIIFLLGCNKSYVKCSTAYKEMVEMWQKKAGYFFYTLPPFFYSCFAILNVSENTDMRPFPTRGPCCFSTNWVIMHSTTSGIDCDGYPTITRFMYEKFPLKWFLFIGLQ